VRKVYTAPKKVKGVGDMAHLSIDGKWVEAKENTLLIDVLFAQGVSIPHFCYHPALGKDGNCRMCMVEIEGKKRPQIACDTPVHEGLVVRTQSPAIKEVRRSILELELINHPVDCPICDQAGECKLQEYYMETGQYESRLETSKVRGKKHVDLGANVVLDQERCVLCTRCVRFTTNITKSHELGVFGRGDAAVIDVYPGKTLTNAYAMNVVDLCPVGALTSKAFRFKKRVWFLRSFEAICPGCARGCNVFVDHHRAKYEDDLMYRIRPRLNEAVNGHFVCDAGRMVYEEQNLKRPAKAYSRGIALSVKEVIEEARREIMHPLSVVVISASASLEELWMARFFESALGLKVYVSCHSDPEFEDDYLRVADREMNVAGAKALGLECICDPKIIFEEARFVVLIGQKEVERWMEACEAHGMPFGLIHAHATSPKARWSLPIASHFERSGRFMAQGGLVQESKAGLDKQAPRLSLVALLTQLFDYSPAFIEETMRALAAHLEGSHG